MSNDFEIDTVHLTATTPNGQTLTAVTFVNGRCGLALDGRRLEGLDWPPEQMEACAAAFRRLAGLAGAS